MSEHDDTIDDELTMDDAVEDALEDEDLNVDDAVRNLIRRRERDPNRHGPFARLYRGETTFDFVGHKRTWFTISTVVIVAGIISIILRGGLNLGIDFRGGTEWTIAAPGVTQTQAVNAVQAAGLSAPVVDLLGTGSHQQLNVQADLNKLSPAAQAAEENRVQEALAKLTHSTPTNVANNRTQVGPTWGSQITNKAITALIIFFVVVGIYISIRFEPKMAAAAFVAMVHDILVTVGVYSLFNFQVTPDTVVAVLTILGYSLYDTVVVFDRVRDNTKGIGATGRVTYTQLINLSMNQTLARSINTSLVAILPVLAVLLVGAELLGATTLQDFGLALFVGLLSGAYSSIFIAAPVLCMFKERESRWVAIAQRNAKRSDRAGSLSPAAAAALATQMSISAGPSARARPAAPPCSTASLRAVHRPPARAPVRLRALARRAPVSPGRDPARARASARARVSGSGRGSGELRRRADEQGRRGGDHLVVQLLVEAEAGFGGPQVEAGDAVGQVMVHDPLQHGPADPLSLVPFGGGRGMDVELAGAAVERTVLPHHEGDLADELGAELLCPLEQIGRRLLDPQDGRQLTGLGHIVLEQSRGGGPRHDAAHVQVGRGFAGQGQPAAVVDPHAGSGSLAEPLDHLRAHGPQPECGGIGHRDRW
jgi:preprotein translocase subunit SecF